MVFSSCYRSSVVDLIGVCGKRPSICGARVVRSPKFSKRAIHAQAQEYLQSNQPDWTESQRTVREAIAKIVSKYTPEFWLKKDKEHSFPYELHSDLAKAGWLGICMPSEYGGSELGISEAAVMMQTISESGAGMAGCSSVHMNIFGLEPVVKFGTAEQKKRMLVPLIEGKEKSCFGVTEPNTGLDTLKLQSLAEKKEGDDFYTLKGTKIWTSTAQIAEKALMLVRTTPLDKVKKPTHGLSLFYTNLDRTKVQVTEIEKMGRAAVDSNIIFFEDWKVPVEDRIGEEGNGFKIIMHGMNAERFVFWYFAIIR